MANVRLIDANALIKHYSCVEAQKSSAEKIRAEIIVQALEKAPTIDPESLRPVANWEIIDPKTAKCPKCGHIATTNGKDLTGKGLIFAALYKYCPNCGARMKG